VYKIQKLQNSSQDGGNPNALSTVHQLHITLWYEAKYRYLNSRRVGASYSASPLEHACWWSESGLWCTNRWQARSLFSSYQYMFQGPGSSVGIATGYGLDGPGIESGNPTLHGMRWSLAHEATYGPLLGIWRTSPRRTVWRVERILNDAWSTHCKLWLTTWTALTYGSYPNTRAYNGAKYGIPCITRSWLTDCKIDLVHGGPWYCAHYRALSGQIDLHYWPLRQVHTLRHFTASPHRLSRGGVCMVLDKIQNCATLAYGPQVLYGIPSTGQIQNAALSVKPDNWEVPWFSLRLPPTVQRWMFFFLIKFICNM
jgi:hypothetical protein